MCCVSLTGPREDRGAVVRLWRKNCGVVWKLRQIASKTALLGRNSWGGAILADIWPTSAVVAGYTCRMGHRLKKARGRGLFRQPDGRLVVMVSCWVDGQRLRRRRTLWPGATLADGRRVWSQIKVDLTGRDRRGRQYPTIGEFLPSFLSDQQRKWRDGASTYRDAETICARHIMPALGGIRVDQINEADLLRWLDDQAAVAMPATVVRRWQLLRKVLRYACADYGLPSPVGRAAPKKIRRAEVRNVVERSTAREIVALAERERPSWAPLLLLGFATGARPSELLAARVTDIDLRRGRWRIRRHLGSAGHGLVLTGTKTDPSGRTSMLAPPDAAEVKRLLKGRRHGWIKPGRAGRPASPGSLRRLLATLSAAVGVERLTAKTFRRSWVTWARDGGMPDAIIGRQLGHTTAYVTDRYEHRSETGQVEAMQDGWLCDG